MSFEIKQLEKSRIEIVGEISAEDFEKAYQAALAHFNREIKIDGFRSGHIPERVVVEKVGHDAILRHAAEDAIGKWYNAAMKEKNIEPIGHPSVVITKIARKNPLGFTLTTAILPPFDLPDYRAISKEVMSQKEEIQADEKEIQETIDYLRKNRAKSERERLTISNQQSAEGNDSPVGHADDKEGALVGLPELNDEFAREIGPYKTLEELKQVIKENIIQKKEFKAKEKKRMEVLSRVALQITIDIPDILIESEKEKMMAELKSSIENMGLLWSDYLAHVKKSEEEIKNGWRDQSRQRVLYGLILREIARKEQVEVSKEEIDEYVRVIKMSYPESEREKLDESGVRDYAYGMIKNEKTFRVLELTE